MGIKLILFKGPIEVEVELGLGFMDKKDFNKMLKIVKSLEDREFDGVNKVWRAPITLNNVAVIERFLTKTELERINALLKNA